MLKLLTTEAFATWFSGLAAEPAEDVAATLEVIVQLGTGKEAPGSSEYLLWYEHPSLAERARPDVASLFSPEIVKFTQDWGRFLGYVKRVVAHLESKPFQARLARLAPGDAAAVTEAVRRIRRLSTKRALSLSELHRKRCMNPFRAPTPYEAAQHARILDEGEVREAYFAALAAAGFEVVDPARPSVLREIALRSPAPGLRLLYGIDEPKNRGLVVLGEWLDRSFYGDSVRRAEALWGDFLGGRPLSTQPAGAL
jgi:hypothetical protein